MTSDGIPDAKAQVAPPWRKLCPEYSLSLKSHEFNTFWRRARNSFCVYTWRPVGDGKLNSGDDGSESRFRYNKFVTAATGNRRCPGTIGSTRWSTRSLLPRPRRGLRGIVFTRSVCLSVCLSVCVCVCVSVCPADIWYFISRLSEEISI